MKRILITGASSGIGEATAIKAASSGWEVIACGRNVEKLEAMRAAHPTITPLVFDITDREGCLAALADISVDVVLLNAGVCEYVDVEDWDSGMFERVFQANVFGVVYCIEALLPRLRPGNQLVFVDSLARLLPFTKSQAYGASKAALFYLAKSMDVDLADRDIRVQTISPGFVKTPLTEKNDFAMPMQVTVDQASDAVMRFVTNGTRTAYFPTLFALIIRTLSLLPMALQVWLCRKLRADPADAGNGRA